MTDTNPIQAVRQRLEQRYPDPVRQCEAKLVMVELIQLVCDHNDDRCWLQHCQACRRILDAEEALKVHSITFSEIMYLKDGVNALTDSDREGLLADIMTLPATDAPDDDASRTGTDN